MQHNKIWNLSSHLKGSQLEKYKGDPLPDVPVQLIAAVIKDEKAATQALDALWQKNIKLITIDDAAGLHKD